MASMGKRSPLVLCYHAVSRDWEHSLSVPPAVFDRQIARLASLYSPLTAEEVVSSGRRGMHITFDDAFRSVLSGLPTLRRLKVPATVFACSGHAVDGRPLHVPELTAEVRSSPGELATMRWDQLREVADAGIEVGSHTATHPHLPELAQAELERELVESRERIEDELRRPCRFLAYPYGEEDHRVRAAALTAGYVAAFAMNSGLTRADLFAIPRVGIWRKDHVFRTAAKIALQHGRKRPVWPPRPATRPDSTDVTQR